MSHKRPLDSRGNAIARVVAMMRDDTLSLARRQPLTTTLHRAVSRESSRLDDAGHAEDGRPTASGAASR